MMDNSEIKALPSENIVFLKKINLENTYSSDVVCYARKISQQYTIVSKKDRQDILMFGYDEEEYPIDDLDQGILDFLHQRFPNAKCHTSLIMFDIEVKNQKRLAESLKMEKTELLVEYSPTSLPPSLSVPVIEHEKMYILHNPYNEGKQRLDIFVQLITSNMVTYLKLRQLLKETYVSFADVLNSVKY